MVAAGERENAGGENGGGCERSGREQSGFTEGQSSRSPVAGSRDASRVTVCAPGNRVGRFFARAPRFGAWERGQGSRRVEDVSVESRHHLALVRVRVREVLGEG